VSVPNSVTSIGSRAFRSVTALTSITLPSSLQSIPSSCFYQCSSLARVDFPATSNLVIESSAFNCDRRREQRLFLAVEKSPEIKRGRRHRCGCRRRSGEGSGGARVRSVPPLVRPCGGLSCGRICLR
jgi:hypothetical protein